MGTSKALKNIDTWLSDCYQLGELVKQPLNLPSAAAGRWEK
jgi:hypothetical protein